MSKQKIIFKWFWGKLSKIGYKFLFRFAGPLKRLPLTGFIKHLENGSLSSFGM